MSELREKIGKMCGEVAVNGTLSGVIADQIVDLIISEKREVLDRLWMKKPPYGQSKVSAFEAGYETAVGDLQEKITAIRRELGGEGGG